MEEKVELEKVVEIVVVLILKGSKWVYFFYGLRSRENVFFDYKFLSCRRNFFND